MGSATDNRKRWEVAETDGNIVEFFGLNDLFVAQPLHKHSVGISQKVIDIYRQWQVCLFLTVVSFPLTMLWPLVPPTRVLWFSLQQRVLNLLHTWPNGRAQFQWWSSVGNIYLDPLSNSLFVVGFSGKWPCTMWSNIEYVQRCQPSAIFLIQENFWHVLCILQQKRIERRLGSQLVGACS